MNTFYFKTDAAGTKFRSSANGGGPWHSRVNAFVDVEWDLATQIRFANGNIQWLINTGSDVINIDGADVTGTAEQKQDAIRAVFPKANSGPGGSGTEPEIAATKAAVTASTEKRLVYVTADETNNGDTSLYIHNGTTLKFLQTVA